MHEKKILVILSCAICVFFLSAVNDEAISEERLHSVTIEGQSVDYTVTTGTMPLRNVQGEKDGVKDKTKRPLMFSFNGGPGSSSVWMHMGFLEPRKVLYNTDGFMLPKKPIHKCHGVIADIHSACPQR